MTEHEQDVWKRLKELEAEMNKNKSTCPSCGHCPHCGRGGHQMVPYYPVYPVYPQPYYPWRPQITWTVTSADVPVTGNTSHFLSGFSVTE